MSRPETNPTDRLQAYRAAVKNAIPETIEKPYFQQNYNEVVELLQHKLLNFIRLNPRLRENIGNKRRFLENTPQAIVINLIEFSEAYRQRFITDDFEGYCQKFTVLLKPVLLDFINEVHFGGYAFRCRFHFQGKIFENTVTVLAAQE